MHDSTALLEPDDLLHLPDGDSYELIDGKPVEKNIGAESDLIAAQMISKLVAYSAREKTGRAFGSQTGYRCFPHRPRLLRRPDASFVANGRFLDGVIPKGDIDIAPDLAVEVVSPNDFYDEVDTKIAEYLSAGVRLVWLLSPATKSILVRRPNKSCTFLDTTDTLSGEDVLPGFSCSVAELFV